MQLLLSYISFEQYTKISIHSCSINLCLIGKKVIKSRITLTNQWTIKFLWSWPSDSGLLNCPNNSQLGQVFQDSMIFILPDSRNIFSRSSDLQGKNFQESWTCWTGLLLISIQSFWFFTFLQPWSSSRLANVAFMPL